METNIGLNTMINNLSSKLGQDITESHLPIGIIYLVVKDVFTDVQKIYEETLKAEIEQSKETKEMKISDVDKDKEEK